MKSMSSKVPSRLPSAVEAAKVLSLTKVAEVKPTKSPPLEARVSSRLLEVAGSTTPSRQSRSKLPPTLGKTPSFVSSRSEGEGNNSHDREGSASYIEKYARKYPDKELPFTDKDRAAAVAMGTRDIKVSLQVKKKKEKKEDEPEEREFQIRVNLAEKELRHSDPTRALKLINKAMEFHPERKECFVTRSRCHLMLGHLDAALSDAETALTIDKHYVKAIYAKAEALYACGNFENALVCYHRGHHLRPELEEFRIGIQKCEDAILNVIGDTRESSASFNKMEIIPGSHRRSPSQWSARTTQSVPGLETPNSPSSMGDLNADIDFMQGLLNNSEVIDMKPQTSQMIKEHVEEALVFLKARQEFWSQQRPASNRVTSSKFKRSFCLDSHSGT